MTLLKISQASEKLSISESTLYRWIKSKRIPHVKMGDALRFRDIDLDRFLSLVN